MLGRLQLADAELSVLLTNDPNIRILNRRYRGFDRSTDVLSFEMTQTESVPHGGDRLLGDVVISLDTAARQAMGRHRPIEHEVRWLLAHGLLHLVGFDHEHAEDKRTMVLWTQRLIRSAARP